MIDEEAARTARELIYETFRKFYTDNMDVYGDYFQLTKIFVSVCIDFSVCELLLISGMGVLDNGRDVREAIRYKVDSSIKENMGSLYIEHGDGGK